MSSSSGGRITQARKQGWKNVAKKAKDITKIAEQRRYLHLLEKVKGNKPLGRGELSELKRLERKYKAKEPAKSQFTIKQQCFIDCYDGDIKKAAKKARISYVYGRTLYTKSYILEAIKHRQDTEVRPKTIMSRQQRQQFWSEVAKNEDVEWRDRLRASELLGKSEADFTDNLSHKFPKGCGVLLVGEPKGDKKFKKDSEEFHRNGNGNGNKS